MTILGPVHASNLCHTIHHETKDMSIMKIENHEQDINQVHHVPKCVLIMHNTHVHQHHAMCQKISSMECINHMPLSTCQHVHLTICQPCASTNVPTMHLPICQPCTSTNMPTMNQVLCTQNLFYIVTLHDLT
jgi:hypothetical protein